MDVKDVKAKDVIKFMKYFLGKNKKEAIILTINSIIMWNIVIILPLIYGLYVDELVDGTTVPIIVKFIILVAGMQMLNLVTDALGRMVSSLFINHKFQFNLITETIQKILSSRLYDYKDTNKAALINQFKNDSTSLQHFFGGNVHSFFTDAVGLIVALIIIFSSDILLGVLISLLLPIYCLIYFGFKKKVRTANSEFLEKDDLYFSKRNESLDKIEFVKRNSVQKEMDERAKSSFDIFFKSARKLAKLNFFFKNAGTFVSIICRLLVMGIGGYRVMTGDLSIGFYTVITIYFSQMMVSLDGYISFFETYIKVKISVKRFNAIYDSPLEVHGDKILDSIDKISISSLSMKYSDGIVFENLNTTFEKGKIYAICGENGSGKTSLLNCIMGLYTDLTEGDILFDDTPIKDIDMPHMRRAKISFVEQTPEFLNFTIDEYLAFGIDFNEEINSKQQQLKDAFNLNKFAGNSNINESGNNFSGGEKQKLSIVRTLSKQSFIVILDEPTSALDNDSVKILADILQKQKDDKITLVVSHDKRILDLCDKHWYVK